MTTVYPAIASVAASAGVYAPQHDSYLLIEAMYSQTAVRGCSVLDLGTGSGIVAIAAAQLGARAVSAFDVSRRAVQCCRRNAAVAGVRVVVRQGSCIDAAAHGPYDLVVANPPYVPADPAGRTEALDVDANPSHAVDAGPDGRMVLDPLCDSAAELLAEQGTLLIVQSEFADPARSLRMLRSHRLYAEVVMTQIVPFGPVLTARARWMESAGLLPVGRREETLVVIRAQKP